MSYGNVDLNYADWIGEDKDVLREAFVSMGKKEDEIESFLETSIKCGNIEVNSDGRVTKIFLRKTKLEGPIPEGISKLTNLIYLDLSLTSLEGPIPEGISKLTNLTYLDLSYNKHEGPIPEGISNLTNLNYLYLSNNELTGAIPEGFSKLTNLDSGDLGGNKLEGPIPDLFIQE